MAPRRSKRQQREAEELQALASTGPEVLQGGSRLSDDALHSVSMDVRFAALSMPDDEPEIDDTGGLAAPPKPHKTKKKKRRSPSPRGALRKSHLPSQATASQGHSARKMIQTAKADDMDEIDKAIAELSIKYPDLKPGAAGPKTNMQTTTLANLLSVSLSHLDAESELRKFFGSKAITAAESSSSGASSKHRRRRGYVFQSQLTRPGPMWAHMKQPEGLSLHPFTADEGMRKEGKGPAASGKWWTVEYTKRYKSATRDFIHAVRSGSPEALSSILTIFPWHVDTLLQFGEVYRHREEFSTAVEHVTRAIFAYERAFLGSFSFTSGSNRLAFDLVENRPFFLAIHQQVIDLQRRGCPRAAFEHARLLFSIEPLTDPHGALLHLDFLSIKSGMGDWFLEVWKVYQDSHNDIDAGKEYMDPSVLPGWAYTKALILREREKERRGRGQGVREESTDALKEAILGFPSIVPLLADKCDISLPPNVLSHTKFRKYAGSVGLGPEESVLHLLSHIYSIRFASLWKSPSLGSWLSTTTSAVLSQLSSVHTSLIRNRFLRVFSSDLLRHSIYRHVIALEQTHGQQQHRGLLAFIPREVVNSHQYSCDPLPPPTARSRYDDTFFAGVEGLAVPRANHRRTRAEARQLERLIPDPATREQIIALFEQLPDAAQLPGGVVQFVQHLRQMDDEMVNDLLLAGLREADPAALGPDFQGHGMMPGEMPAEDNPFNDVPAMNLDLNAEGGEEEEDEEEDESDGGEDVASMPARVIRNLLNRLWGRSGNTQLESSGDDTDSEAPGSER